MQKLPGLSIFFPVYNDEYTIETLIKDAYRYGKQCATSIEVIAINDGSTDNSSKILSRLKKEFNKLRVISHERNQGYGAALATGFSAAKKPWVFYTDSDGQYHMKDLPKLVSKVTPNIDVVNGFKISRSDNVFRIIAGSLYNKFLHVIYAIPISDVDCDFRLIKKKLLKKDFDSTSGAICTELILSLQNAGANFSEVGVHHYPRKYGRSQFLTFKNLFLTISDHIHLFKKIHTML